MKSLRYLNCVLTVLAVLLGLNLWTTWMGTSTVPFESSANAQNDGLSNAGAQRSQMIDLLKKQVAQMDELASLLKSGNVHVKVDSMPEKK